MAEGVEMVDKSQQRYTEQIENHMFKGLVSRAVLPLKGSAGGKHPDLRGHGLEEGCGAQFLSSSSPVSWPQGEHFLPPCASAVMCCLARGPKQWGQSDIDLSLQNWELQLSS